MAWSPESAAPEAEAAQPRNSSAPSARPERETFDDVACADPRALLAATQRRLAARGLSPLLYETDLGGEFSGDAWDGAVLAVGAHHETRAPEAHGRR